MTPPPIAVNMMLCEQVIVDYRTKNPTPVSIFNGLAVEELPSPPQRLSVFAVLTDGRGRSVLRLVVNCLDGGDTVYEQEYPIDFPGPLILVNVNIRVRGIRFPIPARYEFLLFVDSDCVAQRTLRVYEG
jgi:hypothetical protein